MRALVFLANTAGRISTWVLSRADRNVCEFPNATSDES